MPLPPEPLLDKRASQCERVGPPLLCQLLEILLDPPRDPRVDLSVERLRHVSHRITTFNKLSEPDLLGSGRARRHTAVGLSQLRPPIRQPEPVAHVQAAG